MNLKKERELLVFTYLLEKGLKPFNEIVAESDLNGDEDFQLDHTLNDLFKEGYLVQIIPDPSSQPEMIPWEITELGMIHMNDLAQDKYEEKIKIPVYIWAVIIVAAILTFMKLFPKMFH